MQKKLPSINSAHGSETRNIINELIKLFNGMGYTYDEALQKAHNVLNEAKKTNDMNKDVQTQINNLILSDGKSDAEVIQARGRHPILKDRLDESDTQLTQIATNVKSHGAKGDGVTDDTQSFINAFSSGNKIFIPSGVYLINNEVKVNKDNVEIFGDGGGNTVIKNQSAGVAFSWDDYKQYENIMIHDLHFIGLEDEIHRTQGHLHFKGVNNVKIYNNYFGTCGGVGVGNYHGRPFENGEIYNNTFDNTRDSGIAIRPFNNIKVHDNTFTNISGKNYPAHSVYLRADGRVNGQDITPYCKGAYIYNNTAYDCISDLFSNEHVFKIVLSGNSEGEGNTIISDIRIHNNSVKNCTLFAHVSAATEVNIFNNDAECNNDVANGSGVLRVANVGKLSFHHNRIENNNTNECYDVLLDSVGLLDVDFNVFEKNSNSAVFSTRTTNVSKTVNIRNNIIRQSNDPITLNLNFYTMLFNGNIEKLSIIRNTIETVGRCCVLTPSEDRPIGEFMFVSNDCKGLDDGIIGVQLSGNQILGDRVQYGNTFYNTNNSGATENDLVYS